MTESKTTPCRAKNKATCRIEHGMSADTACNCGALQGRVRVVGSLTDLTRQLVNDF